MVCSECSWSVICSGLLRYRDAWAKHKDLDPYEAKWLYVDALLKVCPHSTDDLHECLNLYQVLRRYSDKTVARDHVREIEAFGGDPANLVHSGMTSHRVEYFNADSLFSNVFEVTRLRFF